MKIRDLIYFVFVFLFLTGLFSCMDNQTNGKIIWTKIDHYENESDSSLYEKTISENSILFKYHFDFEDTSSFLEFKLLNGKLLVIASKDTIVLCETLKIEYKTDSIEILKFEFPDSPPGGQGCWLFNKQLGMVGMGLYIGSKLVISKLDNESFNSDAIAEIMKMKGFEPPPPPKEIE